MLTQPHIIVNKSYPNSSRMLIKYVAISGNNKNNGYEVAGAFTVHIPDKFVEKHHILMEFLQKNQLYVFYLYTLISKTTKKQLKRHTIITNTGVKGNSEANRVCSDGSDYPSFIVSFLEDLCKVDRLSSRIRKLHKMQEEKYRAEYGVTGTYSPFITLHIESDFTGTMLRRHQNITTKKQTTMLFDKLTKQVQ